MVEAKHGKKKLSGMWKVRWSKRKVVVFMPRYILRVSKVKTDYTRTMLLNIYLVGVTILLLTVVLRRKRWSQI